MVRTFVHRVELDPEAKKLGLLMFEEPSLILVVAGACFVPDWERERAPLVTAHWVCRLAKQGAREMQRVGLAV